MSGTSRRKEISSVAEKNPSMVGDHISLPGLVVKSHQCTEWLFFLVRVQGHFHNKRDIAFLFT